MRFMRIVDRWIGIPICFIFSCLHIIGKLFGAKRRAFEGQPHNILFMEIAEMGTAIVASSAIREAKQLYPHAKFYFLIFKELKESAAILNLIPEENILTIRSKSFFTLTFDTIRILWTCRTHQIDTVIDLEFFSRYSTIISYLSGARRRVGFYRFHMEGLYRGNFLTHNVAFNPYIHTAQVYYSLIYALRAPPGEIPLVKMPVKDLTEIRRNHLKLTSAPEHKKVIWDKLKALNPNITEKRTIVVINPNSSELIPIRKWPTSNYSMLIKKILNDYPSVYVVITGVKSEKPTAQEICTAVQNDRCIDFTGQVTLRQLIDLYNTSKIIITNDSGPVHFASLTNIKIFVFLGPETPVRYAPLSTNYETFYSNFACSPCVTAFNSLHTPCTNNLCLKTITPEYVYSKIKNSI